MKQYSRSTRLCPFRELRPELIEAIRAYAEKHELGDVGAAAVLCAETTSTLLGKPGFFARLLGGDRDPVHHTALVLTPDRLVWTRSGEASGLITTAARLDEVEVRRFQSPLIEDTGLDVSGFVGGSSERVTAFVELGPEPAAEQIATAAIEAAAQARR